MRHTVASKVFLHIGAPLVPSSGLRDALARHRRRLARVGVLYPPSHLGHAGGHRDAVLDVLGVTAGDHAPAVGAWDRLAETVRDWRRGTAVVSHELLSDATESQVDRIVSSLGTAELHVVYVAQDLGRQLPRAWQGWVHGGAATPFSTYAARVADRDQHRASRVFWRSHDLGDVLSGWTGRVPADRVHVVTAARGAGADEVTWGRFARVLGVDPDRFRLGAVPAQPLASLAGTEVLRLLNAAEGPVDPRRVEAVRRHTLAVGGVVPRLPAELRAAVTAESELATKSITSNGWHLAGELDDLLAHDDAFTSDEAAVTPAPEDVVRAQTEVLLALTARPQTPRGPAGLRRRALRVLGERVRP